MEQLKKQKGVTMIALVVTIVLMLIIASIMVATFSGKSGMTDSAMNSKVMTELAQLQDTLNSKRAEGEGKRLKAGDYSGELSNDDLAKQDEPIIREFETSIPNENEEYLDNAQKRVIGVVSLKNLGISSSLGNNEENYKQENSTQTNTGVTIGTGVKLDDFTDVFFITVDDNDLYYIQDGKLWSINGEVAKYELNKKEETKVEGPILSATPETGSELESPKTITLKAEKKTNEIPLSNEYQYYLSTNDRILSGGSYNKFTFGDAYEKQIEISGSTGISYYLFVKQFTDGAGEKSSGGELITVSGITYHRFGPYTFKGNTVKEDVIFKYTVVRDGEENDATEEETRNIESGSWINNTIKLTIQWIGELENKQASINGNLITNTVKIPEGTNEIIASATGTENKKIEKRVTVKVDTISPTIEVKDNTENKMLVEGKAIINANIKVSDKTSGINEAKYGWSNGKTKEPDTWEDLNDEIDISKEIYDTNSYYLWIKAQDNAQNSTIEQIEFKVEEPVAEVEIAGNKTYYTTIQDAIDACPKDETIAQIKILKDVEQTGNVYKQQNIVLDLNGHSIDNASTDIATIENNGLLNIIDSSDNENNIGKINSTNYIAIKNNEQSTLTVGIDDENVSTLNPQINGKINGILNNGTFNFYDGIIKANKAIKGDVTTTPKDYSAVIDIEDGTEIATLGILADNVAKIKNIGYSTLPKAIEAAQENDVIVLLKPITLTESLVISEQKNITIDLAGNNITTGATSDYMIKNYGKLKIISNVEQKEETLKGIKCEENGIVDTGIKLENNYKIEAKIKMDEYKNTYNNIWGTKSSSFESYSSQSTNTIVYTQNGKKIETTNVLSTDKVYNIVEEYKDQVTTLKVNNQLWASGTSTSKTSSNVKLFATTADLCTTNMTMYSFKIYKDDSLVLDLVPVKNGETINGKVAQYNGFYDNISNTFKYSNGTEFGFVEETKTVETVGENALISSSVDNVIINNPNAYLTINNVQISTAKAGTTKEYKMTINNLGSLKLENNANIQSTATNSYGVYNTGILENDGAIIKGYSDSIYNEESGTFENKHGILNNSLYNKGKTKISSGVVKGISNYSSQELLIEGGYIYGSNQAIIERGLDSNIKITGGAVYRISYSNSSMNSVNLDITNGNLLDMPGFSAIWGSFKNNATINIHGGNVETISLSSNTGNLDINIYDGNVKKVYNSANTGSINIFGGIIKTGIEITKTNKILTIGKDDGNISQTSPEINGQIITNGNTFNFYDGKIISNTNQAAIDGEITNIPENSELNYETISNKEVITLKKAEGGVAKIVKEGKDVVFNSIQDAVNGYNGEESGIVILRSYNTQENVTIDDKEVLIDLNGKTITSLRENFITNNGSLGIKDSQGQGTISGKSENMIVNNNNLKITSGIISLDILGTSSKNKTGITNNKSLVINGGTIKSTKNYNIIIKNSSTGTLELLNGTVQCANVANSIGIDNEGEASIKGGNIKSASTNTSNYSTGVKNSGKLIIEDGNITKLSTAISNVSNGIVNIYGGTIQANTGIGNKDGEINITSGSINAGTGIIETSEKNGKINIEGGTINVTSAGINSSSSTTEINMSGGQLVSTGNYGMILSYSKINLTMSGGTITVTKNSGNTSGIYMLVSSQSIVQNINITGGSINSKITNTSNANYKAYGIYITSYQNKNYNAQTLTIGEKGGSVSKTSPEIVGTTMGIYNANGSVINFYDGIIKGKTSIEGKITEYEENYEIIKETQDDIESAYLDTNLSVAKIGEQTYQTLEEAFDACTQNQETTVEITRSLDSNTQKEIEENKNIILDLKGYTLSFSGEKGIVNNGTLKIIDSVGDGIIKSTAGTVIENNKTMTLSSGVLSIEAEGKSTNLIDGIINTANLTIEGGTVQTIKKNVNIIKNTSTGNITINNGNINSLVSKDSYNPVNGIYNLGKVEHIGGSITNLYMGINNKDEAILDINGGEITNCSLGVKNNNSQIYVKEGIITSSTGITDVSTTLGNINIQGGTINADKCIALTNKATLNITGGILNANNSGITASDNSNIITMTDGEINSSVCGVNLENVVTFKMAGGKINVDNKANNTAIGIKLYARNTNYEQNVEITGGTISAKTASKTYNACGIYMTAYSQDDYKQTLIVGINDGNVNDQIPNIYGGTYGIYNENRAKFNFYDGIIKGNKAIEGETTKIEENYEVIKETQDGLEIAYLGKNVAAVKVGENKYYTLEDAFNACEDGVQTTVEVLRDISIDKNKNTYTISENKNIILDIKGYTIEFSNDIGINNNGTLKVVDSVGDGIIRTTSGAIIENNKQLTLSSGIISVDAEGSNNSSISGVINKSNLNIDGTTLQATRKKVNIVKNESTGHVVINNGKFNSSVSIDNKAPVIGIKNLGEAEFLGGNIIHTYIGIDNLENGKVSLDGGLIEIGDSSISIGIRNNNGEVYIKSGKINAGTGIQDISTTLGNINIQGGEILAVTGISLTNVANTNITGGTVSATSSAINISGNGNNLTMTDGTLSSSSSRSVYIGSGATFKMLGGTIEVNSAYSSRGIEAYLANTNYEQNIEIIGGTINARTTSTSSSQTAIGIYINSYQQSRDYKQTVTIGKQDKNINISNPLIVGDTYGVYNNSGAVFNFYDGKLKGKVLAMLGNITRVENKYTIVGDTEDEYQTASLGLLSTNDVTAFVNGTYYSSLQLAIDACNDGEETYVIMANGCILNENINIGTNKNIILDLNGFVISSASENISIVNDGTLTVMDSSEQRSGQINCNITGTGTTNQD